MTLAEIHAKAQRAAEWYRRFGTPVFETEDGMWQFEITEHERTAPITTEFFIEAAAKIDGWQDDHSSEPQERVEACADEEEALDCCARGMAQFMDEVDPDPIQLNQSVFAGIESHCRKVIEISNAEINASNSIESRAYYNGAKQAYRDILKMVAQHQVANEADGVEWKTKIVDGATIYAGKDPIDVCVHNAFAGGKKWGWSVARYEQVKARGTAQTREEARRQAVEAARRIE